MTVETFDAGWLALREPVDHRSRSVDLVTRLVASWGQGAGSRVVDLGSGTGSNLRYLAPRLSGPQVWTLVDHDAALLALVEAPNGDIAVETIRGDLGREGLAAVSRADVVTASALLDLVSETWMEELAGACAATGSGALFVLTYDGSIEWVGEGGDPDDQLVREAVNAHQRRDKGLGSALGPIAGRVAEEAFRRRGYRTWTAPSPWRIGPDDTELARVLVAGWTEAALQECPGEANGIRAWAERRLAVVDRGDFELIVGHVDLLALPAGPTAEAT